MEDIYYFDYTLRYSDGTHNSDYLVTEVSPEEFRLTGELVFEECIETEGKTVVFHDPPRPMNMDMTETVPQQTPFAKDLLDTYLQKMLAACRQIHQIYANKRRTHHKCKVDPPSTRTHNSLPEGFQSTDVSFDYLKAAVLRLLEAFRRTVFTVPDFDDVSSASLRHTAMGILADSYKVYLRFTEDLTGLLQELYSDCNCEIAHTALLFFLADIEAHPSLLEICHYSVVSKASTPAKRALRACFLELLALKHNTTPVLAQEKVPGFTYEHIESLDEVVELVEQESVKTDDSEIERFRQTLARTRGPVQRVQVKVSAEFLSRLEARLKRKTMRV